MKIALLGSHSATKTLAPFSDEAWEIWACSPANAEGLPRFDAWFELHRPAYHSENRRLDYMEFLAGIKVPLWMRDRSQHPNALDYPEQEMKERFGPFFFTSSIACMFAFAIAQGADEIGLWGIQMASHEEYAYQRSGCQYFIQRAWDAGIKVTVPPQCKLLNPPEERW